MNSELYTGRCISNLIDISSRVTGLGQCWHETTESRVGACDGGERCRNQAVKEVDGMAFCEKHGFPERDEYSFDCGV